MSARRAKVAPVLHALLDDLRAKTRIPPLTRHKAGDAQVLRVAEAELRALLSLEGGAGDLLVSMDAVMQTMPMVMWAGRADAVAAQAKVRRALARLRRASGGEGERSGR